MQSARRLTVALAVMIVTTTVAVGTATGPAVADPSRSPELVPFIGSFGITATWDPRGYHRTPAIDVAMPIGTRIYAAGAGEVIEAGGDRRHCDPRDYGELYVAGCIAAGFGNSGMRVRIRHDDGRISVYLHLDGIESGITPGSRVTAGQPIATSGNTGISEGPHLHYAEQNASRVDLDPGDWVACHGGKRFVYDGMQNRRGQTIRNDGYACHTPPPPPPPPVRGSQRDLVFVIDTTGSMADDIDAVKRSATSIVNKLSGDFRVALVDYKDHPVAGGDSSDYPERVRLGFSANKGAIVDGINGLQVSGGGDIPESVYSGIMRGLSLNWRAGASRSIIWMGDAPPKDPEPVTGFTFLHVVASALSKRTVVLPGAAPSVRTAAVASESVVAAEGDEEFANPVKVFAVEIGSFGGPVYRDLPAETGGQYFQADDATEVVDALSDAIEAAAGLEPVAFAVATQAGGSALYAFGEPVDGGVDGAVRGVLRGRPVEGAPITEAGLTTMDDDVEVLVVRFVVAGEEWELRFRATGPGPSGSTELCGPTGVCEAGPGVGLIGDEAAQLPGFEGVLAALEPPAAREGRASALRG